MGNYIRKSGPSSSYLDLGAPVLSDSEHWATRSLHLSLSLEILRATCQLTPPFQVFFECTTCTSPCLLWPRLFLLPSSPKCCMGASFSPQSEDVASFLLHTFVTSMELLQCSAEEKRRRGRYRTRVDPRPYMCVHKDLTRGYQFRT